MSIRGGATTVLLSVWGRYILPSAPLTRILSRRACASPRLEQEHTSKYFCWRGDHASMSQLLTFRSARSPEQHSSWRTGMSMLRNSSTLHFHICSYHFMLSSGLQTTIISCFSNWWMRYTPRSSMPWEPFSLRKQGE